MILGNYCQYLPKEYLAMIDTIKINKENVKVKDLTANHIIEWCKANGEVEWLKETCAKQYEYKVYPKVRINGKLKADKTQEPTIKKGKITFVQLKSFFIEKFFPEAKATAKKPSFLDIIANL